ncbi:VOC family protein [Candidatus Woesearchaeota archaeon]|nr:VOC family protein [Candidatus Woesearchaeota archaeon]
MDKVQHFEIPAKDMKRAEKFYRDVFGWKIQDVSIGDMKYSMAHTAETDKKGMTKETNVINGAIMEKDSSIAGPVVVITVGSINRAVEKVRDKGGSVVIPKNKVENMGMYARVKDTEGNIIGLWENIRNAG